MAKYLIIILFFLVSCSSENKKPVEVKIVEKDLFTSLLEKSKVENKNLFLVFSFRGCGWCIRFEKYHHDSTVNKILAKHFIIKKIDINKTPGGKELYNLYGKPGFPSWVVLDSAKHVIADSDDTGTGRGNVGYPGNNKEIAYYISIIKKADPAISPSNCKILAEKLKEYYHK